jgi:hypothetical protein
LGIKEIEKVCEAAGESQEVWCLRFEMSGAPASCEIRLFGERVVRPDGVFGYNVAFRIRRSQLGKRAG